MCVLIVFCLFVCCFHVVLGVVVVVVVVVVLLMYLPAAVWGLVSESLAIRAHCNEMKFSSTALTDSRQELEKTMVIYIIR